MLSPRIFNFLQLCSFGFPQIRLLKASKYRFQITAQFSPELAVLVSVRSYVKLGTYYLKRSQPWACVKHAAYNITFSWSFIHSHTFNHNQTRLVIFTKLRFSRVFLNPKITLKRSSLKIFKYPFCTAPLIQIRSKRKTQCHFVF